VRREPLVLCRQPKHQGRVQHSCRRSRIRKNTFKNKNMKLLLIHPSITDDIKQLLPQSINLKFACVNCAARLLSHNIAGFRKHIHKLTIAYVSTKSFFRPGLIRERARLMREVRNRFFWLGSRAFVNCEWKGNKPKVGENPLIVHPRFELTTLTRWSK
jgi:hypothetical protein